MGAWSVDDSLALYNVAAWGEGFFTINEAGRVEVRPRGADGHGVDLLELVQNLEHRGLCTPLLIRFSDILASRVRGLAHAFQQAIAEYGYKGAYRGVYPIKVNQQRHVVEEIIQYGKDLGVGLEAGSKPELLVALALLDTPDALIICNGYKDRAYIETALLAQRLGSTPVIVVDRFHEVDLVIKTARELGIQPHIGVRARLLSRGAGRWEESTGDRSKFGLSAYEIVNAVERLRSEDMLDCLELLHFHIGSQITAIRAHKDALAEASRIFTSLHEMGAAPRLLDVGGGLGVDYDGSRTNFHSSRNYSTQEYAEDVVSFVQEACDEAEVPHPDLVTEAGRAMVAHHSVLVFDVLGVGEAFSGPSPAPPTQDDPKVVQDFSEVLESISSESLLEAEGRGRNALFPRLPRSRGARARRPAVLDLLRAHLRTRTGTAPRAGGAERSREGSGRHLLRQPLRLPVGAGPLGGEAALPRDADPSARGEAGAPGRDRGPHLRQRRKDQPLHRPDRREGRARAAPAHGRPVLPRRVPRRRVPGDPGRPAQSLRRYRCGARHARRGGRLSRRPLQRGPQVGYQVEHVVEGDSVEEVLRYVQYERSALAEKVRRTIEEALRRGKISLEESARLRRRYAQALDEGTYLSRDD